MAFYAKFKSDMISNATNHGSYIDVSLLDKYENAIELYYTGPLLILILLFLTIRFIINYLKNEEISVIQIVLLSVFINLVYILFFVNKEWQHYYLTVFLLLPLVFIELTSNMKIFKIVLIACLIAQSQQLKVFSDYYNKPSNQFYKKQLSIARRQSLNTFLINELKKSEINKSDNILIYGTEIGFDFTKVGLDMENILYRNLVKSEIDLNAFIAQSKSKGASFFFKKKYIIISKNRLRVLKNNSQMLEANNSTVELINNLNEYSYDVLAENNEVVIWKKRS